MKKLEINPAGDFSIWNASKIEELERMQLSENIGDNIVVDNELITLWELTLQPKERIAFRRHRHPFLMHCVRGGTVVTRYASGKVDLLDFDDGESVYQELKNGYLIQDLENVGHETMAMKLLQFKNVCALELTPIGAESFLIAS